MTRAIIESDKATGRERPRLFCLNLRCRPANAGPITTWCSLAKDGVTSSVPISDITRYGSRRAPGRQGSLVLVAFQLQNRRAFADRQQTRLRIHAELRARVGDV